MKTRETFVRHRGVFTRYHTITCVYSCSYIYIIFNYLICTMVYFLLVARMSSCFNYFYMYLSFYPSSSPSHPFSSLLSSHESGDGASPLTFVGSGASLPVALQPWLLDGVGLLLPVSLPPALLYSSPPSMTTQERLVLPYSTN